MNDATGQAGFVSDEFGDRRRGDAVRNLAAEAISRMALRTRPALAERGDPDRFTAALLAGGEARDLVRGALAELPYPRQSDRAYAEYVSTAAAELGHKYDKGLVAASDVVVASRRLEGIMRAMAAHSLRHRPLTPGCEAIFAATPGETHSIGVRVAADLIREEGWQIELKLGRSHADLIRELSCSECRILGLSANSVSVRDALRALVDDLRVKFPGLRVLVAGQLMADPAERASCGAPWTAASFDEAARALTEMRQSLHASQSVV
jgi:methanogenic corrinoid protein MtbC1